MVNPQVRGSQTPLPGEAFSLSGVYHSMYPATVLLPTKESLTRVKLFLGPEGIAMYWAVPSDGASPDWYAQVDYQSTCRPSPGREASLGWDVYTLIGLVVVTKENGCGCGWPLKRWSPRYARKRLAWPTL